MFLKKILIFFIDIVNQRKNQFYINKNSSYQIMRTLYRLTNGIITNAICYFLSGLKYNNSNNLKNIYKNLENINSNEIEMLSGEISKMRVFDQRKINFYNNNDVEKKVENYTYKYDQLSKTDIVRIDVLKSDLLSNKIVAKFVLNEKWINAARKILNVEPNLIDVTSWYTLPYKNQIDLTKYGAQIWHRDVDKLRDIKIFIYLSDVNDSDDGPFEILVNSHKSTVRYIKYVNNNNFRIFDENIKKDLFYKKHAFIGKKGNNFIVDTRCLHRGGIVKEKPRHVLELYFSNSIFGKHEYYNNFSNPKLNKTWESSEIWNNAINKYPKRYSALFLGKG